MGATVNHQAEMKMLFVLALAATAAAEAEADPYYGSYGYGGYGLSYGRTYGGYGLSYGRRYGGYGLSYGGLYGRGYYGKREAEAEADPTFRKRRKNKRRPSYRR